MSSLGPSKKYAAQARYRKTHPEVQRGVYKRWVEANPEKRRASYARWAKENAEKRRASRIKYEQSHVAEIAARRAVYRARYAQASGSHTADDIRAQYEKQEGRCFYCRMELNGRYQVDHMVPLSRGGSNDPDNLCCACAFCNSRKGKKTHSEFMGC